MVSSRQEESKKFSDWFLTINRKLPSIVIRYVINPSLLSNWLAPTRKLFQGLSLAMLPLRRRIWRKWQIFQCSAELSGFRKIRRAASFLITLFRLKLFKHVRRTYEIYYCVNDKNFINRNNLLNSWNYSNGYNWKLLWYCKIWSGNGSGPILPEVGPILHWKMLTYSANMIRFLFRLIYVVSS